MAASTSNSGQPPPHKRARIHANRDQDDYMRGNIIKISVHNFMTYSDITTCPGPRLNLVIGPNGTGKSSLVCAIAIGLGGDPHLLGRAGHIGEYVKRGEESGWIKISLRGDSPDEIITITRKFNKQNKSEWLINDKPSTKKAVNDTVHGFNIQVDNLTQFLPQDRVCEFAKMSPVELLEETEKAVGDPELSNRHARLIVLNQELKQRQQSVSQLETFLNRHVSNNAELEREVERVQERNRLQEKVKVLKQKLPWLKYDKEKSSFKDAKEREEEAKTQLQRVTEEIMNARAPLDEKIRSKSKAENAYKKMRENKSRNETRVRDTLSAQETIKGKIKAKLSEIEEHRRAEASRAGKIRDARHSLQDAENELANFQFTEPPVEQTDALRQQIFELESKAQEKKSEAESVEISERQKSVELRNCQTRLAAINDVKHQRLELLKNLGCRRIAEAYNWVNENRHQFRRDVFGPVLLEVNIQNRDVAGFVEGQVANYIWKAFVTQDSDDRDLLVRNLKQFEVPVINFTGQERPPPGPAITPQMERLGVSGRLDQVVNAPQVVKDVLIGQFALNHSFFGTLQANNQADEVSQTGIQDLWTPENHFRWQKSRYGGPTSAMVNPVRPARLFSQGVNAREMEELQRKKASVERELGTLAETRRGLIAEQRRFEDEAAPLHREREQIVNRGITERRRQQELSSKVEQRKRRLESLENEDVQGAVEKLQADLLNLNIKRADKAVELKEALVQSMTHQMLFNVQYLAASELDTAVKHMERDFKNIERSGVRAQQAYDTCKADTQSSRERLAKLKADAEKVAEITPDLQQSFEEMPDTIEDLEEAIEQTEAQANAVFCQNPNVLYEYERRRGQIEDTSAKLEQEKISLNRCSEEMNTIQSTWLATLRESVLKINASFSRNFREMAVAGEVSLDEHGTDFDKYGIHIKVKFRETGELQVLSAHHQSGGERSVSTILYLVSLQDLTHCPFRVVDEINQGMDPINERKMFQQLVRAASQPNTPQCFLLTPKLLPDLEYSEACSVLYIMNGPWIGTPSQAWKNGESWSQHFA